MSVWCITDGKAGMVAQARALAELLDMPVVLKTVHLKPFAAKLPSAIHALLWKKTLVPKMLTADSDALDGPLPKLVISCGRRGGLAAMSVRAQHPDSKCRFVHIGDPYVDPACFDLVIAMAHDRIQSEHVMYSEYALHGITPQRLEQGRTDFAELFSGYAQPVVSVLLGGSTNKYRLSRKAMDVLILQLKHVLDAQPCSLLITASRRTGEDNLLLLKRTFEGNPRVYLYDSVSANPYMGLLACADYIMVSNDSVNMMSEAVATGKPVYILPFEGHENTKPSRFAIELMRKKIAKTYGDGLKKWNYIVPNHMHVIAQRVRALLEGLDN